MAQELSLQELRLQAEGLLRRRQTFGKKYTNYAQEVIQALLSRLDQGTEGAVEAEPKTHWLPIDAAPKTGKPLLLRSERGFVYVGYWSNGNQCWWDRSAARPALHAEPTSFQALPPAPTQ